MKKILVSVFVIGALVFTSCKSEKKEVKEVKEVEVEVVNTEKSVKDAVKEVEVEVEKGMTSALEGVTIPSFSNEAVSKNLLEYAQYAKNYVAANGSITKITAMAAKGASLLKEGKALTSKLDASELTKYKSVLSQIQAKMAPSK
ncbi:MAG: hypothetical protein AB8B78_10060 [Polaribacter sp.]